ncbi:hypothetical protein P7K49_038959, partial [Saguinus oedipus]
GPSDFEQPVPRPSPTGPFLLGALGFLDFTRPGKARSPLADAQRVSLTQTLPPNPWIGAPLIT